MVRPTDEKTIAIKTIGGDSPHEEGSQHSTQGHTGRHQGWAGGRESGEMWARAFIVVFTGRKGRGKLNRLQVGRVEEFRGSGQRDCPQLPRT